MPSDYPDDLDVLAKPSAANNLDSPGFEHDLVHVAVAEAIEAVQATLGTNPEGGFATLAARVAGIGAGGEVSVSTLLHDANTDGPALDVGGAFIRIGDGVAAATLAAGAGIKFHDAGIAHHSLRVSGSVFSVYSSGANGSILGNPDTDKGQLVFDMAGHATLKVVMDTGQSADAFQMTSHAGATLTKIDANGFVYTPYLIGIAGTPYIAMDAAGVLVLQDDATKKVLRVRGAAAQSADLQQWQASDASVLANVASDGSLRTLTTVWTSNVVNAAFVAGDVVLNVNHEKVLITAGTNTNIPLVVRGVASQAVSVQEWRDSADLVSARMMANGSGYLFGGHVGFGEDTPSSAATFYVKANTAAIIPLMVRGNASQTGDLTQWQDSSATELISIEADGILRLNALGGGSFLNNVGGGPDNIFKASANSKTPLVVRGTTSQVNTLQEWQDVGGAVLFSVTEAGLPVWDAAANQQTTVGAAGGASALPATPVKYLKVKDSAGATYVIPAYNA